MARILRLSMGLLVVSMLSVLGLHVTTGQEATPTSPYIYIPSFGLNFEGMISSPDMSFPANTNFSVGLQRLTFEPGVELELDYWGPVEYYVDEGTLGLPDIDGLVLTLTFDEGDPTPDHMPVMKGNEYILMPGQSVFAEDGRLGRTRNVGTGTLVVYAMLVVPDQGGLTWGVTGDPNATPMNEIEIGS
jgi:hypothetical protein